jgi:hypothetical protein
VGLAAALIFAVRADPLQAAAWLGAAFVLGVAAAASAAAARAPANQSTAAALDKELQLEDRVATALQFLAHGDAVAGLIVRDAAARISGIVPVHVFPLDLRSGRRLLVLPAAAALLAALVAIVPEAGRQALAARLAGRTLASGSARALSRAPDGEQREAAQTSLGTAPAAAASSKTDAVEAKAVQREGGESARASTDARDASLTDRLREPSSGHAAQTSATDSAVAATSRVGDEFRGGGDGAPTAERRTPHAAGQASRAGAGISGGTVAADAQRRDGGGVSGGEGSKGLAGAPQMLQSAGPLSSARYRAAWARAEASLSRNEIPAGLRNYLRAYFAAIRPTERE